jgi:hypothetical protein
MAEDSDFKPAAYAAVCAAHDGVATFRAQLLALLPIASSALVFVVLRGAEPRVLIPSGAFGAVVTFGLFVYELRGIQTCLHLQHCGGRLERDLLPAGEAEWRGRFAARPTRFLHLFGNRFAALVIYPTVMAAWTYVFGVGFTCGCGGIMWLPAIGAAAVGLAAVIFGALAMSDIEAKARAHWASATTPQQPPR